MTNFFSNGYYSYRLLGHTSYVGGSVLKVYGYNHHPAESEPCQGSSYSGAHPVRIGVCLQGISILIIITQLLQLLRLRPGTSTIYSAMQRSIKTIISFFFFYFTVLLAFSLSIFHVVHESTGNRHPDSECPDTKHFDSLRHAMYTLLWVIFDDANPELFDCREGVSRHLAIWLFYLFNMIMALVLINLLIAVMSIIMSDLSQNQLTSWKCHRLKMWMQYCNNGVVLPPPMNLLDALITLPVRSFKSLVRVCTKTCQSGGSTRDNQENGQADEDNQEYQDLVRSLAMKYANLREGQWRCKCGGGE